MRTIRIVSRRGTGRAAPGTGAALPDRSAVVEDALHILLVAGVLLGLPALAWTLRFL